MASPDDRKEIAAKRTAVVQTMISSLQHGEPREYHVSLVGYYIEGVPYPATGLSLNHHTPLDFSLTDESFTCTAFFQPHVLDASIVIANGIVQRQNQGQTVDVVPVRLQVRFEDIWAVAEFVRGKQYDLFLDPETAALRLTAFLP